MGLYRTRSAAVFGIDAHPIDIEVDVNKDGSKKDFITVGMPDLAIRESRERIKSALLNSGFGYPPSSVTVNLAPANIRKEGAGFDLPMALAILGAMGFLGDRAKLDHLVAGTLPPGVGLLTQRPFRSPHHAVSDAGLVGGGSGVPRPGEVSLAHNGILFLDELPEFARYVLEHLRQPLEDGKISLARTNMSLEFPAKLMLVGASNPCPCGYFGDASRECRCTGMMIQRYMSKISGPLLDRIDLHIEVPAVPYQELRGKAEGASSADMRGRVLNARATQQARGFYNAHIPAGCLREICALDAAGERTLELAVRKMSLSARAHDRILKVARTIADLGGVATVAAKHVAEAVQYRSLDRGWGTL